MMFGVYGVYSQFEELIYIGSTKLKLEWLEDNHRNWRRKNYSPTLFRESLEDRGDSWTFKWIQEPRSVSKTQIEIEEGALIRYNKPLYNVDQYPYEHSVREGRLEQI